MLRDQVLSVKHFEPKKIMLMVAQNIINSLIFSDSDPSEPLDFTMSKFKSSSPTKHPLYHQFYGSSGDVKLEPQGRWLIFSNTLEVNDTNTTKRSVRLRDF